MTERPADAVPPDTPATDVAPPPAPRRGWLLRLLRRVVGVILALVAALVVAGLVIDLGPSLRERAEREGSRLISRPMHIGRLSVSLLRGRFLIEDFRIEGLTPQDQPFFTAKRIDVRMPWWTALRREVFIESVAVSDWRMVVETYPGGRHSFIKLPKRGGGPRRFVTTVQLVRAMRGEFVYNDHATPWSVVARNADVTIARLADYRGEARATGGTVRIQRFEPMWADMYAQFRIDGGMLELDRIDLVTDGAESKVKGSIDLARWPEQIYDVRSRVHFPRMREIFFAGQQFSLSGEGDFTGTFHLFKGGRELKGSFASAEAGLNQFRFPDLKGDVLWLSDRLEVTNASSAFYGGLTRFEYSMAPLGRPTPALARFDARYEGVDLAQLTDLLELEGIRLSGRATGRNLLEWPMGEFRNRRGEGELTAVPPAATRVMTRELPDDVVTEVLARPVDTGPFERQPLSGYVPVGGEVRYRYGPGRIDIEPGHVATRLTYVAFEGQTDWGRGSRIPFHVTCADWQEGDRVLAGIITAFGSPTRAVPVGGHGTFDGVMLGDFARPRVEGRFVSGATRAWDVTWGHVEGDVVIENGYVDVKGGVVTSGDARMDVDGRFALGYPRRDGGEEINARVRLGRWPMRDLKHAFALDDYDVDGVVSGEFHLYDRYEQPHGFGRLEVGEGVAYGEPFESATSSLRFEGAGVRLDSIDARKGGGLITGAAWVGWDGTYSFNALGQRVPVESLTFAAFPKAPLTGMLQFSATGSGTFDHPRYEVRARVEDLFLADEGIGQATGRITVRDDLLTIDQLEAASPRLAISGGGRVSLAEGYPSDLTFRFTDTSLDPYARALQPRLSPLTTVIASGTLRLFGKLGDLADLRAAATIEQADLRLVDYRMRNDGSVRFTLDHETVRVERLRLVGEGTQLEMVGEVGLRTERIGLRALGDANLGILQGFFKDLRSSGAAEVQADIRGTYTQPIIYGSAVVTGGRLRHFSLPHALESVNGRVEFNSSGIRLDGLTGRLGGGAVSFAGRIGVKGLALSEFGVSATGTDMRLRYPEGVRSVVDADLVLRGPIRAPVLAGTVNVKSAVWSGPLDTASANLLELAAMASGGVATVAATPAPGFPIRFDVRVNAPSTLRIESRLSRLVASADLTLRGSYDQPVVVGRVEIERGQVFVEGNRYDVTRGTVDFANPTRIEPFFDVEAETRARAPGQVYRVVFRASGTPERMAFELSSDPPLSEVDIVSLLFGDVRNLQDAELGALRAPNRREQDLVAARAARLLASPISSEVGRVVQETLGVDTVQITPTLGDLSTEQAARLNPSARLTLGKRVSDKLYLTYSRALNASTRDQIILIEFTQSDRVGWVVSQNEDRSYTISVRVRYVF